MSAALELIRTVEANGGQLRVENGWLIVAPEEAAAPVMKELRQHKAEIVGLLQLASIPPIDPAEWRQPFKAWLNARCFRTSRWFTAVYALHDVYCDWEIAQNGVPCDRDLFLGLLAECGFLVGDNGAALVPGLTLRADMEAFNLAMKGSAIERSGVRNEAA